MNKKYHYTLSTENYVESDTSVIYDYNKTKNIELSFSQDGFKITLAMTVKKSPKEIFTDRLFRDAIRKATILRLVVYNQAEVSKLIFTIDDKEETVYDSKSNHQLFWLMSNTQLITPMSKRWKNNDFYMYYTGVHKSKYKRRIAALYAFIMAKSKVYETERFTYLWLTMAGIYEYIAESVRNMYINKNGFGDTILNSETKEIKFMSYYIGEMFTLPSDLLGSAPRSEKDAFDKKLRESTINILDQVPFNEVSIVAKAIKNNDLENIYVKQIDELLQNNELKGKISIYSFILLWFAYQMRCNYFHSEKTILLFAFENESPIGSIRVLNYLLEDYLDHHLYQWFKPYNKLSKMNKRILEVVSQVIEIRTTSSGKQLLDFKKDILL